MNELFYLEEPALMTVREVAEILNVSERVVQLAVKKLYPEIVKNGVSTLLNETQVTAIKLELESHHNLEGTFEVSTRLERQLYIAKALQFANEEIQQLQGELLQKEQRIAELEPKAEVLDKMIATASDVSVRELAAILAVPHLGQNKLFQRLRQDGYIDHLNRPYRQYIEAGLMYDREYYVPGMDATKQQLRVTQKGVAYFVKKYGGEKR